MIARAIWVALVALALGSARAEAQAPPAPGPASTEAPAPDDGGAAFAEATRALAQGQLDRARAGFESVAIGAPRGPWAAQALVEAATIAERQGDLAGARAWYRQVLADHASARAARLAEVRLAAIELAGGVGGRWDAVAATHDRLLREAAAGDGAAVGAMARMLADSAGYPRWVAAAIWVGDERLRAGDALGAGVWYRQARQAATTGDQRFRAGMAEGNVWLIVGDLDRAQATYRAIDPPDAVAAGARDQALAAIERSRRRAAWAWVARGWLTVSLVLAFVALRRRRGSWPAAVRGLWPPPIEVAYLLPVAAGFALVAETGNQLAARAAQIILLGGLGIGWLSGAVLGATTTRGRRLARLAHLAVLASATAAVIYLALARQGLLDLLIQTWQMGHDGQ